MKTILILLFTISAYGQDTLYTAKSVYQNNVIKGYVLCTITKADTVFKRVDKRSELPKSVHWKKHHGIKIKHYPKEFLLKNEEYRWNLRSNNQ